MIELVTSAGLPAPEIEDAGGCVTVRFRTSYVPPMRAERELTDRQRAILVLLAGAVDGLALSGIVLRLNGPVVTRQVREDLQILRTLGLITSVGHGRGARWKRQ